MAENFLKQLINEKYGPERFLTGCIRVAQWLQVEVNKKYSENDILAMCSQDNPFENNEPELNALKKLFGVKSFENLQIQS